MYQETSSRYHKVLCKIKTAEVFICAAGMAGTKSNIPIRFRDIKQAVGNFTCFHVSLYQFKHVYFKVLVLLIYFKTHPIDYIIVTI